MNKVSIMSCIVGGLTLMASTTLHAVVAGNLLTNDTLTTGWQNCEGSDLVGDSADSFDPSHLNGAGCVYRETAAEAGQQYKMTCGVSSFKYSSITLAFLDANDATLAEQTTEIFENVDGGAYSVTLTAPAGSVTAAVGIYGLEGSGFQDCTLLLDNPPPAPVDGSIGGLAWFDQNEDSVRDASEGIIPATPVSIYLGTTRIGEMETGLDGAFYFGGLDTDQCYIVKFEPADPTLTYATAGSDNAIADAAGATLDICLTDAAPNVPDVLGGFVAVPPPVPPMDYAVCGEAFLQDGNNVDLLSDITVTLTNVSTDESQTLETNKDGSFSFSSLGAGDYVLTYVAPAAFSFIAGSSDLNEGGSFADANGVSSQFNIPAQSNTGENDACTIRNANVGFFRTPVALDPTIANDDTVSGIVGEELSVLILQNDEPCDGNALEVDLIGHNIPGNVVYDEATESFVITSTTDSGTYSIEYGLRGACGSYDTAVVTVTIEDAPVPPVANVPDAPKTCKASIGKNNGDGDGVHVDLHLPSGRTFEDYFSTEYRFYDAEMNLVYTGLTVDAGIRDWGIFFRNQEHGIVVLGITHVTAVENGIESEKTECVVRLVTPIAIDTNKSGQVESIAGNFKFDLDGDGISEQLTEWFGPNEGILVVSDFGDAISGEHLFGDTGGLHTDGFAKLALEDQNADGRLLGKELDGLAIWTDLNSNQSVDEGEISTLEFHSIKSLSLEHYKYTSRATLENGKTLLMRDLWFGLSSIEQAAK